MLLPMTASEPNDSENWASDYEVPYGKIDDATADEIAGALDDAISPSDDGNIIVDVGSIDEDFRLNHIKDTPSSTLTILASHSREMDDYRDDALVEIVGDNEDIPQKSLDELEASDEGKIISVRARVRDVTSPRVNRLMSVWRCQMGHRTYKWHERWESTVEKPANCSNDDCKCNPFDKLGQGWKTDVQQLVLSEIGKDDRSSMSVVAEVDKNLMHRVDRRDAITAYAHVHIADTNKTKVKYYLHILGIEKEDEDLELDEETVEDVEELAEESDDIIQDLADSVAPEIVPRHGHDAARKAILCSIVRGIENRSADRDAIHALLYGKPESGKSRLLEFAERIAEASHFVDAAESSKAGLTASVQNEETLHGEDTWILTAGALPQADGGVCCVDELDKAETRTQSALNTPMASGFVKIDKVATAELSADVSVIAAANPKEDLYLGSTPLESLDLPHSTQTRFDLIIRVDDEIESESKEREKQREILRRKHEGVDGVISEEMLTAYLAYARQLNPEMSEAAREAIVDKLVELRVASRGVNIDGIEVGGRTEAAMTRLSAAVCKLRLGEVVTADDVEHAWELIKESWQGLTFNAFGFDDDVNLAQAAQIAQNPSQQAIMRQTLATLSVMSNGNTEVDLDVVYASVDADDEIIDWALSTLKDQGHVQLFEDDDVVDVIDLPA